MKKRQEQNQNYTIKFFNVMPEDPETAIPDNVVQYYGTFDEVYAFANEYLTTMRGSFLIKHENQNSKQNNVT